MRTIVLAAAVAAVAGTATGAFVQEATLSEADVQNFIEAMTEDAQRIMESGDWEGIRNWIEQNVAEEARITVSGTVAGVGAPSLRYDLVATRDNVMAIGGMMLAGPHGAGAIEDFILTSEIEHIALLPNGEAVASVRFHESGGIALPEGAEGGDTPRSLSFHSSASCDLRLAGSGEDLRITVMACLAATTM